MLRSWFKSFGLAIVIIALAGIESGQAKKKGKVKTTFRKLKCAACFAVVGVMKAEVEHEWESKAGDTILVEKRKKKTKVSYVDSELSVQEALDRVCEEDRYRKFNVTSVKGIPRYLQAPFDVDNKEFKKHLSSTCQVLLADFEHDVVQFFYTKKGTSEIQAAERAICTDVAKMCSLQETDKLQISMSETPDEDAQDAQNPSAQPVAEQISATISQSATS